MEDRLRIRAGGEDAQEPPLAGDATLLVEDLDADVVEVGRAVHGRARVGLGDDEQLGLAGLLARGRVQPGHRLGRRAVVAEDAEAGAAHGGEQVLALVVHVEGVLAVAEEGEVVGGQPLEEPGRGADLLRGDPHGRVVVQRKRDAAAPLAHLAPVLDGVADVAENGAQLGRDLLAVLRRGDAVDLQVHPRLGDDAELVLGRRVGVDLLEGADGVPSDDQLRVHDEMDGAAERVERGGDRVDEERHVVGDDLDDGVPAGPALRLDGRVRHVDVGGADGALTGEVALGQGGPEEVLRLAREEVLGRRVPVEHVQQPVDVLPGLLGSLFGGGVQLLGPGLLERRRHRWFVFLHWSRGHASSGAIRGYRPCSHAGHWVVGRTPGGSVENGEGVCAGTPTVGT